MEVDQENRPVGRWILRNLLLAVLLVAALLVITQVSLKFITRHNQEITVPDFTNLSVPDARIVAKRYDIRTEVTDSVYVKRMEKGHVFSQNPAAGSKVKKGRSIKLTINAHQTKMVKMPNLVGYSLRQAKTEILAAGLTVGKLSYREDLATNNVLDQFIKGRYVAPGTEIEAESPVDLLLPVTDDGGKLAVKAAFGLRLNNVINDRQRAAALLVLIGGLFHALFHKDFFDDGLLDDGLFGGRLLDRKSLKHGFLGHRAIGSVFFNDLIGCGLRVGINESGGAGKGKNHDQHQEHRQFASELLPFRSTFLLRAFLSSCGQCRVSFLLAALS